MYDTKIFESIESLPNLDKLQSFYDEIYLSEVKQIAKGDGIKIAILDSGVDYHHPFLKNRVNALYNVFSGNSNNSRDYVGHGTYIAGLICSKEIGIVPNATINHVKVADDYGRLCYESLIDGIKYGINRKVDIICLALGSPKPNSELEYYINMANSLGIIIVSSAGNDPNEIEYPAKYENVLSVGSVDYTLKRVTFSAAGGELDIVLPATDIPSSFSFNRYAISSGSSSAAAIATGIVAQLQQLRVKESGCKFDIHQLRRWFKENTIDLGEMGFDNQFGYGVPTYSKVKSNDFRISYL